MLSEEISKRNDLAHVQNPLGNYEKQPSLRIQEKAALRFTPFFKALPFGGAFSPLGAEDNTIISCFKVNWVMESFRSIELHPVHNLRAQQDHKQPHRSEENPRREYLVSCSRGGDEERYNKACAQCDDGQDNYPARSLSDVRDLRLRVVIAGQLKFGRYHLSFDF